MCRWAPTRLEPSLLTLWIKGVILKKRSLILLRFKCSSVTNPPKARVNTCHGLIKRDTRVNIELATVLPLAKWASFAFKVCIFHVTYIFVQCLFSLTAIRFWKEGFNICSSDMNDSNGLYCKSLEHLNLVYLKGCLAEVIYRTNVTVIGQMIFVLITFDGVHAIKIWESFALCSWKALWNSKFSFIFSQIPIFGVFFFLLYNSNICPHIDLKLSTEFRLEMFAYILWKFYPKWKKQSWVMLSHLLLLDVIKMLV